MYFTKKLIYLLPLVAYASILISPAWLKPAGFFAFSIPFWICLAFVFLLRNIYRKKIKKVLWWGGILALGMPFLQSTYQFPNKKTAKENSFSVLSYNVRIFNVYASLRKTKGAHQTPDSFLRWLISDKSDIKCLQEYYNNSKSPVFNTGYRLGKGSKHHYHTHIVPKYVDTSGAEFGLAIFSKFPIVGKGVVPLVSRSNNGAIYADLKIGHDTLRVLNFHLESMHLSENMLRNADSVMHYSEDIYGSIRNGIGMRANQAVAIHKFLRNSPYPYILCGDLNEVPYSFTYRKLKSLGKNSFEEAGSGFGFTFNGNPSFLRIDQQFFSDRLSIHSFQTLKSMRFTDHFPIKASYRIKTQ